METRQKHDPVNHPSYYCEGGIETLDFILAKRMDFLSGQVIKYLVRAGKKDPAKELEDHMKARFYLDKKISLLKKGDGEGNGIKEEAGTDTKKDEDDVLRAWLKGGTRS